MHVIRKIGAAAVAVVLTLTLAACTQGNAAPPAPSASPSESETPGLWFEDLMEREMDFNSEFSRDGTYQSHTIIKGMDFVYTIWSAKATPRMQEWAPKGSKYFSFTFQAYDTRRRLRDPFRTKRKVWMEHIAITSVTSAPSGGGESPYEIDGWAPDLTFDPEARTRCGKRRAAPEARGYCDQGMLITSPKGAFELRNQSIKEMADDTDGATLTFRATVHIQDLGKQTSSEHVVELVLPIAIYTDGISGMTTRPQPVPYNAT